MIKLFVGGFPLDMDEQQLAEMIAPHGDIQTVKIVRDKKTRICKGYGFVEVSDQFSAEHVILALDGMQMGDRQLTVSIREEEPVKPAMKKMGEVKKKRPRRIITIIIGITATLLFASWGRTGHSTIGRIAEAQQDVYTALQQQETTLANANVSSTDRVTALKYIIHFVGDIRQPMHVSRADDKGGNSIQ
jgi:RNA recognition motif-containing protein